MTRHRQDLAVRHTSKLVRIVEEETGCSEIIRVRKPPECVRLLHGSVDAHAPILSREPCRTAEKAEENRRQCLWVVWRNLNAVGHIDFRHGAACPDAPRR